MSRYMIEENARFMRMAYDGMGLAIYIIALDSYEVIYENEAAIRLFGDIRGRKCHEALNGSPKICEQCIPASKLEAKEPLPAKPIYLLAVDKHINTYENLITLPDGSRARLCRVMDISEQVQSRAASEAREKARAHMQYLMYIHSGFINSAKSMLSAAALDGGLIFVNKTMSQTLGFSQEEIMLMRISDFHPPEIARAFKETYIPQATKEGLWTGDSRVLKKDGSTIPVRVKVFPIRNEEGEIIATAAIMDDITDVLVLERMNRYQIAIMESSANYIGVSDLEGNTMYHSPGAYRMLGYKPGETSEWDRNTPHPEWYLKRLSEEGIPTAMKQGQWVGRGEVIDRFGKHIPIEQTIFPIFDDKRQHMGVATIITDISEQVEQEKEIEAGRRMLRTIIDAVPSAIFWKDRASRFLGANRQFARDAGVDEPERLIGLTDYDLFPEALAVRHIAADRDIFETGEGQFYTEEALEGDDGAERWISKSKVLIRDEANEPYALLGIYDDITRIKQNGIKLEQAMRAAEEASRTKGEFLSRMSHEIRTPMNAIKGLAELLALTELGSIQENYVRNIVKSSNSLLSIINDVLDFAKINENKIELVHGPYMLGDLIAEACNVVSLRAAQKGLMLLMDISPTLPKALIGDEVRVKQVIINILNNAVKYTPKGHVIMRLYGEQTDGGFELVCVVEDTGIGIRSEDIPFLFEAFAQADRRVNHNIQGTGLGLSISDRLIRAMGGIITVESEYGKGSSFTARFPARIESCEPLATVENPDSMHILLLLQDVRVRCVGRMLTELGTPYTTVDPAEDPVYIACERYTHCIFDDSFSESSIRRLRERKPDCVFIALKDMRYAMGQCELQDTVLFIPLLITELVKALAMTPGQCSNQTAKVKAIDDFALTDTYALVVDDNEINLIVSEEILRAYKAEVVCADSGQAALDMCEKSTFDLIFMDHMMPGMDGVETTIAIRKGDSPNKTTPIIALTANVVNDMASYYIENGMDDFISKPIEIEQLRRVLLKWLPESKITTMKDALLPEPEPEPAPPAQTREQAMARLIRSLDDFGMYVSDVMREIGNDYDVFINRMDRIRKELSPLVARLRSQVRKESWDDFARDIASLGVMIHNVGARDCSGRARKLSTAARERNIAYIKGDFFSLMDNMYMLEKKMEVAVPLARGSIGPDVPFGDMGYCRELLAHMKSALELKDPEAASTSLDALAHYSLDHDLDLILVGVGARLAVQDFKGALELHGKAIQHCDKLDNL